MNYAIGWRLVSIPNEAPLNRTRYKQNVHRRSFLACAGGSALAALSRGSAELTRSQHPVRVVVDVERKLGMIPRDFIGLGYEISSVPIPDLLSAKNRTYVQLVRTLSPAGVIRIGGNTSDYSSFVAEREAVSKPKGTMVNSASLRQLATFLNATNWRLIWGLNLGSADMQQEIAEAEAVMSAVGDKLFAFEIGNEPDLFGRGTAHRPKNYDYEAFIKEFQQHKAAIRAKLPTAPFAGPMPQRQRTGLPGSLPMKVVT